jgi:hypothetical protein
VAIKNRQSRETDNTGPQDEEKQSKNTTQYVLDTTMRKQTQGNNKITELRTILQRESPNS